MMEPVVTVLGRSIEGNSIWWWSSVRRMAMPASSLPTVNCTLVGVFAIAGNKRREEGFDRWHERR